MRKFISSTVSRVRAHGSKVATGVAGGVALIGSQAQAAIDTAQVATNLTAAQTTAEGVGTTVLGFVAALVVVGICIALVKKA